GSRAPPRLAPRSFAARRAPPPRARALPAPPPPPPPPPPPGGAPPRVRAPRGRECLRRGVRRLAGSLRGVARRTVALERHALADRDHVRAVLAADLEDLAADPVIADRVPGL